MGLVSSMDMRISTQRISLTKRHPLTISRGTITGSVNVVVSVEHDGIVGMGEMAPSDVTNDSADRAEALIAGWSADLEWLCPNELDLIEAIVDGESGGSATRAALDMACHDWLGKKARMPVWQILGVNRDRAVPTSLTIGIDTEQVIRSKVAEILARTHARILKVKLGQPAGIEADQAMFANVQEVAAKMGASPTWRVDANCGWTIEGARTIVPWLESRGVDMIEQPLPQGEEEYLGAVRSIAHVPVFLDESIRTSADVARYASQIDGVNLKLMKCGGIREALRIIHTARAHGLKVMIGCMGESSLAISGAAQIGGLVDAIDLDSHLNLIDDPFEGAAYVDGRVVVNDRPGLGVRWKERVG
jgi:L-Ala-D/L-Glu epimerase